MTMPARIIIHSQVASPRLTYVANHLGRILKIKVEVFHFVEPSSGSRMSRSEANSIKADRVRFSGDTANDPPVINNPLQESLTINYGKEPIPGEFNIYSSGFIFERGTRSFTPPAEKQNQQTVLFPAPEGFDLTFDPFSAIFYMLSRYEEYLPFQPDHHGRFEADQSLAMQYGFLEEPVTDQWIDCLTRALQMRYPSAAFPNQEFQFVSTIDIDRPWAYLHQGGMSTLARLTKNSALGRFNEVKCNIMALLGFEQDPYDTFSFLRKIEHEHHFKSLVFLLLNDGHRYDMNHSLQTKAYKKLVHSMSKERVLGLHTSYQSFRDPSALQKEINTFNTLAGSSPSASRQHFLLLTLPSSYRKLVEMGIRDDYSMGYSSRVGFRAGTCRSFMFYDLTAEQEFPLLIHPFALMDVTLRQYMQMDPRAAEVKIFELIQKVRQVRGTFISIWHNESLSDKGVWKGWPNVFVNMIHQMTNQDDTVGIAPAN
jgi:hypothetical protein